MSIKRVEFTYRKPHLRYDSDRKVWIGHQVDVRAAGRRYRDTFATKAEAERFVTQLRASKVYNKAGLKIDPHRTPTVSDLFRERLKEITNHAAEVRATRVFEIFRGLLDHDLPLPEVRKAHFKLFIKRRTEDGVKPETVNREINELSAAFRRAAEIFPRELEDFEPQIARPAVRRGKRTHHEITEVEAGAIVKAIHEHKSVREYPQSRMSRPSVALMFELAWLLGLRIGEAERLVKSDWDRRQNTLRVIRWKTNDLTLFPSLPDRVCEVLEEAVKLSRTDKVFDIVCSRNTVVKIIRDACAAAGISYGRDEIDGVTFHSTRHSFASRLVRVTDPATAASFTGHSSLEMLDYYSHASEDSRKRAMAALYGSNGRSSEKLREIFDQVRAGDMEFEQFLKEIGK